jgi:hypothetical protein
MRDYKKEYADYHGTPEQIKRRASRNRARRMVEKAVGKAKIRGKDVDHKNYNAEDNRKANLRLIDSAKNRSRQPKRS